MKKTGKPLMEGFAKSTTAKFFFVFFFVFKSKHNIQESTGEMPHMPRREQSLKSIGEEEDTILSSRSLVQSSAQTWGLSGTR